MNRRSAFVSLPCLLCLLGIAEAATPLPDAATISGSLAVGQTDHYEFAATAGQSITLTVADTTADESLEPRFVISRSDGTALVSASGNVTAQVVATIVPANDTYTVSVYDNALDDAGSYELNFAKAPGANENGAIADDFFVQSDLTLGDLDSYTFAATSGQSVTLTMTDASPGNTIEPQFHVYDPTGDVLTFSSSNITAEVISVGITESGTHTVVIKDFASDDPGGYELQFAQVPGANELGALVNGVTQQLDLTVGDLDSFTFTATQGQTFSLYMTDTSVNGDIEPQFQVYRPDGSVLTFSNSNTTAQVIDVPLPVSGTYTVVVKESASNDAGTYSLLWQYSGSGPGVPPATTLISPTVSAGLRPTYVWNRVPTASWYQLWVENENSDPQGSAAHVHQRWYTAAQAGCATNGNCQILAPKNIGGAAVRWWVRTWNSGGFGPWSSSLAYNSGYGPNPAATVAAAPLGSTGAGPMPTFEWPSRPSATWYRLWVEDSSGAAQPRIDQWFTASSLGCASGGTCSVVSPANLSGSTHWWAQTYGSSLGADLFSVWSAPGNFLP